MAYVANNRFCGCSNVIFNYISVKFIKVIRLDCGSVSLNYDYKTSSDETAEAIVSHIITALDFASAYLLNRLERK